MSALPRCLLAACLAVLTVLAAPRARADTIIKNPRQHADYKVELEPHMNFAFWRYDLPGFKGKGDPRFGAPEFGGGLRATIKVADPAFIPKLNDTVGVTFGVDFTGCPGCKSNHVYFRVPAGIQWTFYVTREFNAFADLGFLLRVASADGVYPDFFAMAGARYLFSDKASLTLRIGYPFVSLGVSFFVG